MSVVRIGSPHGLLFDGDTGDDYLTVGLTLPDVTASKSIYGHYANRFDELIDYFRNLADHWRGWEGVKSYKSLEGDLFLDATHRGHVILRVRLRNYVEPSDWLVEGEITIEPGEELSRAVTDLQAAFA